jgi:hypothetical protein
MGVRAQEWLLVGWGLAGAWVVEGLNLNLKVCFWDSF